MNSAESARKICDCLSDGYDDEEDRKETETALYNDIMTTSLWVDIILEVAEYLVMWLWNFTK